MVAKLLERVDLPVLGKLSLVNSMRSSLTFFGETLSLMHLIATSSPLLIFFDLMTSEKVPSPILSISRYSMGVNGAVEMVVVKLHCIVL